MSKLKDEFKKKMFTYLKEGRSLSYITSKTGIGKTTVYYHMRKLHGRKIKQIVIDLDNLERIGEIIGFFAGDGNYYYDSARWETRIRFYFNKNEKKVIEYYAKSLEMLIQKKPLIYPRPSIIILEVKSKSFAQFLFGYLVWKPHDKIKTIGLKNKGLLHNKKFLKGFLRGLLDSDGYVRKGRKEIYYGSASQSLFQDFVTGLNYLKIKYKVYLQTREGFADFHKVRLSGEEVDKFVKLIQPIKAIENDAPTRN